MEELNKKQIEELERLSLKSTRLLESEKKSTKNPKWYLDGIEKELEKRKKK